MKKMKILLPLIGLALCGTLAGCDSAGKTELTMDNYLEYFDAPTQMSDSITFSNNSFIAPAYSDVKDGNPIVNGTFTLKEDKVKDAYYSNVKFSFKVNYYLNKTSISASDEPSGTTTYTSQLHYVTFSGDSTEYYYVGVSLSYGTLKYYDKNGKSDLSSFDIPVLASNFETNMYMSSDYLREIKLVGVSGTVETGGLAGMNTHHCN